jgi:hypothetical protein
MTETGCKMTRTGSTCMCGSFVLTGVRVRVLRMPYRGRFMCPLAVAVLRLRYLRINFTDMLGHPLRNPQRTAFRRDYTLGLHRD